MCAVRGFLAKQIVNPMCKFKQRRAWRSSDRRYLPGNKSRQPKYGSRIFSSNERSDARDREPKLVWHGNAPRADRRRFQSGSACGSGSEARAVSGVWQTYRERAGKDHSSSTVEKVPVSSNFDLPAQIPPPLAARLLPLRYRGHWREPGHNPPGHPARRTWARKP